MIFGTHAIGQMGAVGPNDDGYACAASRHAAEEIMRAVRFWRFGYGYRNRKLPDDHPLRVALGALAEFDKTVCHWANLSHEPERFDADSD